MRTRENILPLFLIILLGTALRLYRLDYQSFWNDEILTVQRSILPIKQVIMGADSNLLPLYYSVVRPFIGLENREFWVRIPSVIFGALSILLLYLILCNWLGKHTGLVGSILLAISPFHVWYSQEARPYAMLLFLSLLSIWLLQQLVKDREKTCLKFSFIISSSAVFYSHTVGIVFIGYLFIYILLATPREKWKNWLVIFGGIILLILPGIYRMIIIPPMTPAGPNLSVNPLLLAYTGWAFSAGFSLGPNITELHMPNRLSYVISSIHLKLPVMLVFSIIFILGIIRLWRKNRQIFWYSFLLLLFPLAFAIFGSIVTVHTYNVRYAILAYSSFLIFLAAGLKSLRVNWLRVSTLAVIILISLISLSNYFYNEHFHKDNNRDAAQFLENHIQTNDLVICSANYTSDNLEYYCKIDLNIVPYPVDAFLTNPEDVESDLKRIIADRDRFWLFLSRIFHSDPDGYIRKYCEKHFRPTLTRKRSGVELILYQRN